MEVTRSQTVRNSRLVDGKWATGTSNKQILSAMACQRKKKLSLPNIQI